MGTLYFPRGPAIVPVFSGRDKQQVFALDYVNDNIEDLLPTKPDEYKRKDNTRRYGIGVKTAVAQLLELTCALYEEQDYSFNRFEKLALFNILYWQGPGN